MSRLLALGVLLAVALAGCARPTGGERLDSTDSPAVADSSAASSPAPDPDAPSGWGPTLGEVELARELVADMSVRKLAGQVIVGRFHGTDPAEPAQLVEDLHLAGVQVTSSSIADVDQLVALTEAVTDAHAGGGRSYPPIVGVDQEGGEVSHLRGIAAEFPAFRAAGDAIEADEDGGPALVSEAARTTGLELRGLGFTWVFAPVADVTIGDADPTIGSRSASVDAAIASSAVEAAVEGFEEVGIVSTTKHFPGHGSATADSHEELPVLSRSWTELQQGDLLPFEAAIEAQAPAVMVAHLEVPDLASGISSSLASQTYDFLRDDLGFEGVAVTDSLGMGAVVATHKPAVTALDAGADLLLMPADTRIAHRTVKRAIKRGELSRARVEEAATRVVALQLWQQRRAAEVPVPDDVAEQALAAAEALRSAAY